MTTLEDDDYAPLCPSCNCLNEKAFFEELRSQSGLYIRLTRAQFRAGASAGCPICSTLAKAVAVQNRHGPRYTPQFRLSDAKLDEDETIKLHLRLIVGTDPAIRMTRGLMGEALEISADGPWNSGPDARVEISAEYRKRSVSKPLPLD